MGDYTMLEKVARAIADENIRSEADPCRLRSWIAALFEPDFPTTEQRQKAEALADAAIERAARAAVEALREPDEKTTGVVMRGKMNDGKPLWTTLADAGLDANVFWSCNRAYIDAILNGDN